MARQNADRQIAEMLEQHGEEWNDATVWRVQGTPVISHKALERIAARAGIVFRAPTILRAERDEAVILVTGAIGDNEDFREEWSIGEALIVRDGAPGGNYKVTGRQAAYPYAMAEKRAKDRVILKLVNLHGLAYSEEEADEFKQGASDRSVPEDRNDPSPAPTVDQMDRTPGGRQRKPGPRLTDEGDAIAICEVLIENALKQTDPDRLGAWWKGQAKQIWSLPDKQYDQFASAVEKHKAELLAQRVAS